jgi:hypothetical protein
MQAEHPSACPQSLTKKEAAEWRTRIPDRLNTK